LAFTGAAGGLLVANDAVAGALVGSLAVAGLIGALAVRERERDSSIGVILAAGLALGAFLLSRLDDFASAATNILFGQIFGVSGGQLVLLLSVGALAFVSLVVLYRPLLFASVDPEGAAARGVRVRLVGFLFLVVLALSVTEAAQVVGTIFVLCLAVTPAAAAGRLSANPLVVAVLSVSFALVSAVGGLIVDFEVSSVKPSVFIVGISTGFYVASRLCGPVLRNRRRRAPQWVAS
ncbi:MAG: metal ABC transporter permease, partial [Acidimicrobiales bacterium]